MRRQCRATPRIPHFHVTEAEPPGANPTDALVVSGHAPSAWVTRTDTVWPLGTVPDRLDRETEAGTEAPQETAPPLALSVIMQ